MSYDWIIAQNLYSGVVVVLILLYIIQNIVVDWILSQNISFNIRSM